MIWLMVINFLNYQIIIFLLSWFLTYNLLFTLKHLKLCGVYCVCVCLCVLRMCVWLYQQMKWLINQMCWYCALEFKIPGIEGVNVLLLKCI